MFVKIEIPYIINIEPYNIVSIIYKFYYIVYTKKKNIVKKKGYYENINYRRWYYL